MKMTASGYILIFARPKYINKMIYLFKNAIWKICIKAIDFMGDVPDQYRTREMYIRVVEKYPGWLPSVPDRFKTQKMCDNVVRWNPYYLPFIPDELKTQGMYQKVVEDNP